ncbi:hypothetical protein EVAR_74879_1 [Eumeta japonica]|uniref:Uncharacterized protein n=1 Tax=Eumeta variegata TaxID=151549 RepID=A0A4C1SQA6_EUMVA|nr:hypothetical protein EVAR_74879_1 [Eumeta japonica]
MQLSWTRTATRRRRTNVILHLRIRHASPDVNIITLRIFRVKAPGDIQLSEFVWSRALCTKTDEHYFIFVFLLLQPRARIPVWLWCVCVETSERFG